MGAINKFTLCFILTLITSDLISQDPGKTAKDTVEREAEKRTYQTIFTGTAPVIDGLDRDECWNNVEWSGNFIQSSPAENKPPSQETAFKILYDNLNIYVFIRAYDKEPSKISRILSKRDNMEGDVVFVEIDSYFDKQTDFLFGAMASGAKGDVAITQDGSNGDDSWNPVWYLKTSIDEKGWCAEMKIPLSQLRFGNKEELIWGLQVTREIYRLQERSIWQFIPKGSPGMVHLFGELHGIRDIKPKRQVEIMPYTVGLIERYGKTEGDPFNTGKGSRLSAGVDGKIGISNDFTVDFTFNPDFGQVEADPSEVNLTAFESYFSERRPFFVEGKGIFQFEPNQTIVPHNMYSDNLFYSRRIGRYPHHYPETAGGEHVKMPEATTIIGAMKLSGKTKNGFSLGILESLTAGEYALIDNEGERRKEEVEPLTNYFVGRVQQDFNKGETVLGGILTAVNRDINTQALDYLHRSAYTAGIDFQHSWKERTWYVAGNAEVSQVSGKPRAILNTQTSSARYFQRPDSRSRSVDSSLTCLGGYGSTIKFGKNSKKRLQFETSMTVRSPGLEFNDIGYMRYSDVIHQGTWIAYYIRNPFAIFNNFHLNTNHWMYWNFSGQFISANENINFNTQFKNRWRLNGQFNRMSENVNVTLLRGGPSFISPGEQNFSLFLTTDESKKIAAGIGNFHAGGDSRSGTVHEYWANIFIKPSEKISLSLHPNFNITNQELQYVTTAGTSTDPVYLFGRLDQRTAAMTFRISYTFNPELSVEYYGQPFISAGRYLDIKKITDPDAGKFRERFHTFTQDEITYIPLSNRYSIDESKDGTEDFSMANPDFNFRQFRSNLVLKWEYQPGSTLYLVWSQGRTGSVEDGTFSYGNDMKDLFRLRPHNVFLLKFSYWFSL
jgi:hypothetical protein